MEVAIKLRWMGSDLLMGHAQEYLKGSLFILISGKSSFQVNLPHSVFKEYLEVLPLSQGGILLTTNIIMKHPSGHQLA